MSIVNIKYYDINHKSMWVFSGIVLMNLFLLSFAFKMLHRLIITIVIELKNYNIDLVNILQLVANAVFIPIEINT